MSTEPTQPSLVARLDALMHSYVEAENAPGLAYGIIDANGLQHARGFGIANPTGAVPTADTPFPIASMSKSFTAVAILKARDRGLLNLDDPITKFFPDIRCIGFPAYAAVEVPTLRMLLSMSSGLTEDNSWIDPQIDMDPAALLDICHRGLRLAHLPGTTYEYSNIGFALAGLALERELEMPLATFIYDAVLAPLGMSQTTFSPLECAADELATGYSLDSDGQWAPFSPVVSNAFLSAGGIVSTVRDLATWTTWLGEAFRSPVNTDRSDREAILSSSSRREMQRSVITDAPHVALRPDGAWNASVSGYGLGLMVAQDLERGTIISHSGGLPGYKLNMRWHPSSGHGVVVLTNSHRGDVGALASAAHQLLLSAADTPSTIITLWPETVRLRRSAESLIRNWSDALAAEIFAENIDFDRRLEDRRAEIERCIHDVGPLRDQLPDDVIVSAATPADVTWTIPGERGDLLCMIHLTSIEPPKIQEFVVEAVSHSVTRDARSWDISPRRAGLGTVSVHAQRNVRVVLSQAERSSDIDN